MPNTRDNETVRNAAETIILDIVNLPDEQPLADLELAYALFDTRNTLLDQWSLSDQTVSVVADPGDGTATVEIRLDNAETDYDVDRLRQRVFVQDGDKRYGAPGDPEHVLVVDLGVDQITFD